MLFEEYDRCIGHNQAIATQFDDTGYVYHQEANLAGKHLGLYPVGIPPAGCTTHLWLLSLGPWYTIYSKPVSNETLRNVALHVVGFSEPIPTKPAPWCRIPIPEDVGNNVPMNILRLAHVQLSRNSLSIRDMQLMHCSTQQPE